jgi:uncharacterized membrane protein YphA (DoxX/SURF4 family)
MDIKLNRGTPGMPQIPIQLPTLLIVLGAGSVVFGLLLLWNEWLLRWMVAGIFLVVGGLLLMTGMRAKKMLG